MNDYPARHHEQVEHHVAKAGVQAELMRRIDDDASSHNRVEETVGGQPARGGHEQNVAGLGEKEVEIAGADVAAHLKNTAPEEPHEEPLDDHRRSDEEHH